MGMGRNVTIYPQAKLVGLDYMDIGDNTIIDDFAFLVAGPEAPLKLGRNVHICSFVSVTGGPVIIGNYCGVAAGARLVAGSETFGEVLTNPTVPTPYRLLDRSGIVLQDHSFIGTNAILLPGVRVPEGCVVAAGEKVGRRQAANLIPWEVWPTGYERNKASIKELAEKYEQELFNK